MKEATKTLTIKSNLMTAFTLGRKQGIIKRLQMFHSGLFFLLVKITLMMMDHKTLIIQPVSKHFTTITGGDKILA